MHVLNGNIIILKNVLLYCYGGYLSGKLFSKAYKNYLRIGTCRVKTNYLDIYR